MILKLLASFILSVMVYAPAFATDCDQANTRSEQIICMNFEVNEADLVLGRTYTNILSELALKCEGAICEQIRSNLHSSQVNWILYRDSFCELETLHLTDRDQSDFQFGACLITEIRQKTENLRVQQLNFRTIYRAQAAEKAAALK